jgi:hypothetical protein
MHYKNGREAKEGDKIISVDYQKRVQVGVVLDLIAGSDTCNATLIRPIGQPWSVNLKDCYHAEDALAAIENVAKTPTSAPQKIA